MAPKRESKKAAGPSREDRISDLPDDILQHIVGFLPVEEAVQTCVLAQRWRHLWKSMRSIRFTEQQKWWRPDNMNKFMNCLLLLRNQDVAFDEVEFSQCPVQHENAAEMKIWIRHVLLCQAQVLLLNFPDTADLTLSDPLLVGRYLRKLKLRHVVLLEGNFLDFASCPVLEDLAITYCGINTDRLSSLSLKHLIINDNRMFWKRARISVPALISLQLKDNGGNSPLFEEMHSLETAIFSFGTMDYCDKGDLSESCSRCATWCRHVNKEYSSLILGGLSSATNLELIIGSGTLIFSRWCPTFTRMKTLLLHVPYKVNNLQCMVCILEHSPVLEKLSLLVPKVSRARESEGSYIAMEQISTIPEHLSVVEIKCGEVDKRVYKILKLLSRFVKHINIYPTDEPLACSKFQFS